jgi:hypothetical protein
MSKKAKKNREVDLIMNHIRLRSQYANNQVRGFPHTTDCETDVYIVGIPWEFITKRSLGTVKGGYERHFGARDLFPIMVFEEDEVFICKQLLGKSTYNRALMHRICQHLRATGQVCYDVNPVKMLTVARYGVTGIVLDLDPLKQPDEVIEAQEAWWDGLRNLSPPWQSADPNKPRNKTYSEIVKFQHLSVPKFPNMNIQTVSQRLTDDRDMASPDELKKLNEMMGTFTPKAQRREPRRRKFKIPYKWQDELADYMEVHEGLHRTYGQWKKRMEDAE